MNILNISDRYSILSAQKSADHDQAAHNSLKNTLISAGYSPIEVEGYYGYKEISLLVNHSGSNDDMRLIDDIGRSYGQESVIHSIDGSNELRYLDGRASLIGEGYNIDGSYSDFYSVLNGVKFRLNVG